MGSKRPRSQSLEQGTAALKALWNPPRLHNIQNQLVQFIASNDLSLRIVEEPSAKRFFKALLEFQGPLVPAFKWCSRRHLTDVVLPRCLAVAVADRSTKIGRISSQLEPPGTMCVDGLTDAIGKLHLNNSLLKTISARIPLQITDGSGVRHTGIWLADDLKVRAWPSINFCPSIY